MGCTSSKQPSTSSAQPTPSHSHHTTGPRQRRRDRRRRRREIHGHHGGYHYTSGEWVADDGVNGVAADGGTSRSGDGRRQWM